MKLLFQQTLNAREMLICACGHLDHAIALEYYEDDSFKEVSLSVNLNLYLPWYRRAWLAVKYVFGASSKKDMWDTVLLTEQDLVKMRDFCNKVLEDDK